MNTEEYNRFVRMMFEAEDEVDVTSYCADPREMFFANVIGCIEDVLMDEKFLNLHKQFMEDHWEVFENNEENKLVYTEIFQKYVETIEKYIESFLVKTIPDFKMENFEQELKKRPNELDGEVFEILSTFSDFLRFKEKFLDYRAMKEGKTADFTKDFNIVKYDVQKFILKK